MPRKGSNADIILEELRILQAEMKSNNQILTRVSTTLDSVEVQTTKTNGRVSRLESRVDFHRGGLYVAYIIIGLAIGLFTIIK